MSIYFIHTQTFLGTIFYLTIKPFKKGNLNHFLLNSTAFRMSLRPIWRSSVLILSALSLQLKGRVLNIYCSSEKINLMQSMNSIFSKVFGLPISFKTCCTFDKVTVLVSFLIILPSSFASTWSWSKGKCHGSSIKCSSSKFELFP